MYPVPLPADFPHTATGVSEGLTSGEPEQP